MKDAFVKRQKRIILAVDFAFGEDDEFGTWLSQQPARELERLPIGRPPDDQVGTAPLQQLSEEAERTVECLAIRYKEKALAQPLAQVKEHRRLRVRGMVRSEQNSLAAHRREEVEVLAAILDPHDPVEQEKRWPRGEPTQRQHERMRFRRAKTGRHG